MDDSKSCFILLHAVLFGSDDIWMNDKWHDSNLGNRDIEKQHQN